jgi:hypothetical protein
LLKRLVLLIVLNFSEGDDGHEIEIEDAIDFNPLQSNVVMVTADERSHLSPEILCQIVRLIFVEFQLHF